MLPKMYNLLKVWFIYKPKNTRKRSNKSVCWKYVVFYLETIFI